MAARGTWFELLLSRHLGSLGRALKCRLVDKWFYHQPGPSYTLPWPLSIPHSARMSVPELAWRIVSCSLAAGLQVDYTIYHSLAMETLWPQPRAPIHRLPGGA